jgi:hypothetical protein
MLNSDKLHLIIGSLEGTEIARIVNIACLAWMVYEWFITLDQEIEHFWTGRWSMSRILFFFNRYIPLFLVIFGLIVFSVSNPSNEFCMSAIQFSLFLEVLVLGAIQAMLILRVWYLFPNKIVQYGMITIWAFSVTISLVYTGIAVTNLSILNDSVFNFGGPGCRAARPDEFWRMFMPSLGLHTVLYILTAFKALRNRRILKEAPVLKRLLRDGGFFFFVVFVSVGFTGVGSFLRDVPQINIPVLFSSYLISVTSVAMTRILFSIHSLASHLGSDPGWLLSNVELQRIEWRRGATEGEIIVERYHDDDHEEDELRDEEFRSSSSLKISRVGVFNENTMW